MPSSSNALIVTGASGHLGQGVLRHLLDTLRIPAPRIIAVTRQPAALAAFAAQGVTVRHGDFDNAAALPEAFADGQRLLVHAESRSERPPSMRMLVNWTAALAE